MRMMSFWHTWRQLCDGSKDVTRRTGWEFLKPGDRFVAILKGQGLKKGEKVTKLAICEVVSNRTESLVGILYLGPSEDGRLETEREGFPELSAEQFIEMFREHMGGTRNQTVHRIEFKVIERFPTPQVPHA